MDFHFDAQDMMRKGHDFRDYICPDFIERHSDYLILAENSAAPLSEGLCQLYPDFVSELTDSNRNMMLSLDIIPFATDEAVREVENRLLGVETNITNRQPPECQ